MSLNDYFQEHIFKPMGVKNINMFPTEHMKENLAWMHTRAPDGKLSRETGWPLEQEALVGQGMVLIAKVHRYC